MLAGEVFVNTDASVEEAGVAAVVKSQYPSRNFAFWTHEAISRSVHRYRQMLTNPTSLDRGARGQADKSTTIDFDPVGVTNRNREPVLELPAVFQKRVIGEKSVNTLQEWECAVLEIKDGMVHAMATSLIAREPDQNFIEIPLFEFQPSDRARLREGVLFRLIIGFVMKANGQRSREALLYIRHELPRNKRDIGGLLDVLVDD